MIRSLAALAVFLIVLAGGVLAAPTGDDIAAFRSCEECGMDRKLYGYSRMLLTHVDGSRSGVCSLHCALTLQDRKSTRLNSSHRL